MVKKLEKPMKLKIKKGDTVKMLSGKDRNKTGKVLVVFPKEGRLVVDGANIVKKHIRPRKAGEKGQTVEIPSKVPVSRTMLICPSCSKATRVGLKRTVREDGKSTRDRICKKCSAVIA